MGMDVVSFRTEWESALDRLELDVQVAEQLLAAHTAPVPQPWEPPSLRGPMPDDLLPRARLLHERQLAVTRDLALAATSTRRHVALTARLTGTAPAEVPVYLDVTA
jgi:hypothetical protein